MCTDWSAKEARLITPAMVARFCFVFLGGGTAALAENEVSEKTHLRMSSVGSWFWLPPECLVLLWFVNYCKGDKGTTCDFMIGSPRQHGNPFFSSTEGLTPWQIFAELTFRRDQELVMCVCVCVCLDC